MKYVTLGRSGLKVSRLCLGTFNFEWYIDQPAELTILEKAFEHGINFIDTANVYGAEGKGIGTVENTIGKWFGEHPGRRDQVVLASKVNNKMGEGVNDGGLSAYHVRKACEDSLLRLKTDHLDLYYLHHFDPSTRWDEIWQALEVLIHQGKILYVGTSNFAAWQIFQGQTNALNHGLLGLVADSSRYNLSARLPELELLPALKELGIGLMPWSPLGGGLLGGSLKKVTEGRRSRQKKQKEVEANREKLEKYESLCSKLGISPANLAMAWLLQNPVVTAPILGARNVEQLEESIKALDIQLDTQTNQELDSIWPGPGGAAPFPYCLW
jgi:aryl-alcohol dehydrogenase-like predicted oxidoreductase